MKRFPHWDNYKMAVDNNDNHRRYSDFGRYNGQPTVGYNVQPTSLQICDLEAIAEKSVVTRYSDKFIWLSVFLGILLCFPVGFISLYFLYTAKVEFHMDHTTEAIKHASIAKLVSLAAIVLGVLWIGLLIGLTAWS